MHSDLEQKVKISSISSSDEKIHFIGCFIGNEENKSHFGKEGTETIKLTSSLKCIRNFSVLQNTVQRKKEYWNQITERYILQEKGKPEHVIMYKEYSEKKNSRISYLRVNEQARKKDGEVVEKINLSLHSYENLLKEMENKDFLHPQLLIRQRRIINSLKV